MLDGEGRTDEAARPAETPGTYDVPTARQVVAAGLQLAVASSSRIRRASIYIGLLALGAFGPTVLLLVFGIGSILGDPATAEALANGDFSVLDRPELAAGLEALAILLLVGVLLLVAISIDAQAIAISLLAGVASGRPVTLAEAVTRARQTFWRLFGAALIVGLTTSVVSLIVTIPFGGSTANAGVTFIGQMIGTLVVTPWAYAATGIVLGDVDAIESLRRSVALYRARRAIAYVVVLFTLVTAAIQTFALSAGLDLAIRVGDLFEAPLDQGPIGLVLPTILVLAFIVAFGSLTFTIAAIVAAPQVVAFLGLTFHSGGLDRARAPDGRVPRGILHWVAPPMAIAMVGLALVAASAASSLTLG